ncbi:uncharacterized protein [Ptychodera flava]|uniref:uncharacterized protein n=1 Tax=Ptychodera flava TaxID=63121 RepID=UPI00396A7849
MIGLPVMQLRNHVIRVLYSKQSKINNQLTELNRQLTHLLSTPGHTIEVVNRVADDMYHHKFKKLKAAKAKKFALLIKSAGRNYASDKPSSNSIVNLSDYTLSANEESVLSRGLKFCPTKPLDKTQLCGDLEDFFRRLRLKEFFHNQSHEDSSPSETPMNQAKPLLKRKDSVWTPPESRNLKLDLYINCFCNRVHSEVIDKHYRLLYNLSPSERAAITSLRTNPEIIIKQVDKGGATVVMNRSDHILEANKQLKKPQFYTKLQCDPTTKYTKDLASLTKTLPAEIKDHIENATSPDPRPGTFYLLPKIHKEGNPGRPIISGIGTITEGISGYVDTILKPFATSTPSYIQDTTDFLCKIQPIKNLPQNTLLVTLDVEALYTNIPHTDGLEAIRNVIPNEETAEYTYQLAKFVLTHNYFEFNDAFYLQTNGTAMGTRMAPQFANIFMADLEQRFLNSYPLKPRVYFRFIDDIFMIWTHGLDALKKFYQEFNSFHNTINFTMEYSDNAINFLDTTVKIRDDHLETSLYRKPTDSRSYLQPSSFHPQHTFGQLYTARPCDTTKFVQKRKTVTNNLVNYIKHSHN